MRNPATLRDWAMACGIVVMGLVGAAGTAWANCSGWNIPMANATDVPFACDGPYQVTDTTVVQHDEVAVNSDGDKITFVEGSGTSTTLYTAKIFSKRDRFQVTAVPFQVTPPASVTGLYAHPMLDGFGLKLLFQSDADLTSENGDRSPETFLTVVKTGVTQQLTSYPAGLLDPLSGPNPTTRASRGSVSDDGTILVFASTGDLVPGHNTDHNFEIFLYDSVSRSYVQLTETAGSAGERTNLHPVMEPQFQEFGTAVSFVSRASMDVGVTLADGSTQILSNGDANYEVYTVVVRAVDLSCDGPTPPPSCPAIGPNTPPYFNPALPANLTVNEGEVLRVLPAPAPTGIKVVGADADGDAVALSAGVDNWSTLRLGSGSIQALGAQFPACGINDETCDSSTAVFDWTPSFTQGGKTYDIKFTVDDTRDTTSQIVHVTVQNVNRPPSIGTDMADGLFLKYSAPADPVQRNYSFKFDGWDYDRDEAWDTSVTPAVRLPDTGDPLTMTGTIPPTASLTAPTTAVGTIARYLTWTPRPADASGGPSHDGKYPVTVTVDDGRGGTASITRTVTVVRNQLPSLWNIATEVAEGTTLSIPIRGYDPDGDELTYRVIQSTMPPDSVYLSGTNVFYWHPRDFSLATPSRPAIFHVSFCVSDGMDEVCQCVPPQTPQANGCPAPAEIKVTDTDINLATFSLVWSAATAVAPGATIPFTFRVQNAGMTTWTPADGYALTAQNVTTPLTVPTMMLAPGDSIIPGASKTFSTNVKAPTQPGWYYFQVRMTKDGEKFGP